jgi:hypothetical protein
VATADHQLHDKDDGRDPEAEVLPHIQQVAALVPISAQSRGMTASHVFARSSANSSRPIVKIVVGQGATPNSGPASAC